MGPNEQLLSHMSDAGDLFLALRAVAGNEDSDTSADVTLMAAKMALVAALDAGIPQPLPAILRRCPELDPLLSDFYLALRATSSPPSDAATVAPFDEVALRRRTREILAMLFANE